jgi:hypothetical protein
VIARYEGPLTNISWSLNGQILSIVDGKISISEFRSVIYTTIIQVYQLIHNLLLGWQPQLELESY